MNAHPDPRTTVRRCQRVVHRRLSDGTGVLLHLDTTAYFGVNEVGALIWGLLESPAPVADLADEVRARVEDPPPTVEDDVAAFLDALARNGLVEVDREHGGA